MAAEEIAHKVVKEDGNIQIRDYESTVIAKVDVKSSREEAGGKAFMTLFNYIQGENVATQEIPMTAPVSQVESQKIPMTAPVSQEQQAEGVWSIAFHMPNDMALKTTPKPKNENVTITEIPARRMAAIRFSGRGTDSNVYEHEKELRAYLDKNEIAYIDEPVYAFYNSPMVPWFLRRNEVLFPLR